MIKLLNEVWCLGSLILSSVTTVCVAVTLVGLVILEEVLFFSDEFVTFFDVWLEFSVLEDSFLDEVSLKKVVTSSVSEKIGRLNKNCVMIKTKAKLNKTIFIFTKTPLSLNFLLLYHFLKSFSINGIFKHF